MDLVSIASASVAAGLLATSASRLAMAGWRVVGASLRDRLARNQFQSERSRATEHVRFSSELRRQANTSPRGGWRVMEVVETKHESDDCLSIFLQDPLHRGEIAHFEAGQFLLVRPALGGANLPSRCYSLSDCPGQPWWRITVKRQSPDNESRKSLSVWIHEYLRAGDCLLVNGPHGQFSLDPQSDAPLLLLAAGVGITPLLSMIKTSLAVDPNRRVTLLYQVADQQHWPFGETLHRWDHDFDNLQVITFMSRQSELPVAAGGQIRHGKFTTQDALAHIDPTTCVYLCGPEAWMTNFHSELQQSGVSTDRIHFESFATGTDQDSDRPVAAWAIHFARSHIATQTRQDASSVWQAANAAGISLPAGCHSGACGSCKLRKLRGSVTYRKPPTCSHAADEIVACIAQPVGELEVDA